jgi:hypothetical protein
MTGRKITFVLSFFVATSAFSEDFPSDPTHVTSLSQVEALEGTSLGAAGVQPRVLMPLALDLIKDFEKWRPNAYNDASNGDPANLAVTDEVAGQRLPFAAAELLHHWLWTSYC